ncbi:DUF4136 domain-containing protein [Altererythrobacter aquiaggeris]|uniref:DUF4136 domain-containing protein n=1 Tax=Aestuarierythrobacter aquiaggeris TaxID=1898396 RepID=UPI003018270B
MHFTKFAAAALCAATLSACVTPVGPVQVTRFVADDARAQLATGTIAVINAPGPGTGTLEVQSYKSAVARELVRLGYTEVGAADGSQIAEVRVERFAERDGRRRGPVSVGVGGSTGSYGSGVGMGVGINLGGGSGEQIATELGVVIRDRATGQSVWEGRASFVVGEKSPLASTQLGAAAMAQALFAEFPGNDGETVSVEVAD